MQIEQPVTANYVASLLGLSPKTVIGMTKKADNPLPCMRVGTQYRFFLSDIVTYFNLPADKVSATTESTK